MPIYLPYWYNVLGAYTVEINVLACITYIVLEINAELCFYSLCQR